jgi:fermentation-respiration switch protein FrsA (DUF1100 family)
MKLKEIVALTVGATATLAGAAVLGGAEYIVRQLTKPQPLDPMAEFTFTPWELGVPSEDVTFATRGGAHEVRGWWLPQATSNRLIIACAGYRGTKSDLLGIGKQLWLAGNNVLLMDFYGHGMQRGAPITLAFREVNDFLGAVDYVAQRAPEKHIGALGFSMGAAVVIQGAARDERVGAVVADSPFATHHDVVEAQFRLTLPAIPPEPFLVTADRLLQRHAGYRFHDVEPLRDVATIAPRPLLIIHSTGDQVIPYQHAVQLYEAAREPKTLWIVDGVPHCGAYFLDRVGYSRTVAEFFANGLAPHQAPANTGVSDPQRREVRGIERAVD